MNATKSLKSFMYENDNKIDTIETYVDVIKIYGYIYMIILFKCKL